MAALARAIAAISRRERMPLAAAFLVAAAWAQDLPTFRSSAEFIVVDAQVLSRGTPVAGLTRNDFIVLDNGRPQPITNCGADEQPLDIMLLLDVSFSTVPVERKIKESAVRALGGLTAQDRVGVAVFFRRAYLALAPSSDRPKVEEAIRRIVWGRPGTELNSSVLNTAVYLKKYARPGSRRAIVMLTDNKGFRTTSDEAVRDGLWDAEVVLNALFFRTDDTGGDADVRRFVKLTGGEILQANRESIPFDEMFKRLRQRYSLLYRAPGGAPGMLHTIRVELTREARAGLKDVSIRARSGYRVAAAGR